MSIHSNLRHGNPVCVHSVPLWNTNLCTVFKYLLAEITLHSFPCFPPHCVLIVIYELHQNIFIILMEVGGGGGRRKLWYCSLGNLYTIVVAAFSLFQSSHDWHVHIVISIQYSCRKLKVTDTLLSLFFFFACVIGNISICVIYDDIMRQ